MFGFLKRAKKPTNNRAKTVAESNSIAAPKQTDAKASVAFTPIDMITSTQTMPGKFNYSSATWKYLQNYFAQRQTLLHRRNENSTLSIEKTQLIRGQLKEINHLFNHINKLAGINVSPTKSALEQSSTAGGNNYE